MPAEYVITFSDVMAGIITLALGILTFFIKNWFQRMQDSTNEIKEQIKENDKKINERVDSLEQETDVEIENIKKQLNDMKGDFSVSFLLREDFFRAMNGVEDRVKSIDSKLDRFLIQNRQ